MAGDRPRPIGEYTEIRERPKTTDEVYMEIIGESTQRTIEFSRALDDLLADRGQHFPAINELEKWLRNYDIPRRGGGMTGRIVPSIQELQAIADKYGKDALNKVSKLLYTVVIDDERSVYIVSITGDGYELEKPGMQASGF